MKKADEMNALHIRQRLHNYLEVAGDKEIEALYAMVALQLPEKEVVYTNELQKELKSRYDAYKSGDEVAFSATESKNRIDQLLKSHKK